MASLPGTTGVHNCPCDLLSSAVNGRIRYMPSPLVICIEPLAGMLNRPKPRFIESALSHLTRNVQRWVNISTRSQIPSVAGVIACLLGTANCGACPVISRV